MGIHWRVIIIFTVYALSTTFYVIYADERSLHFDNAGPPHRRQKLRDKLEECVGPQAGEQQTHSHLKGCHQPVCGLIGCCQSHCTLR